MKIERSKLDRAYDHITGIDRNYPDWPSTFGPCLNSECTNSARGSGRCADCHEEELAKLVGTDKARAFHDAIKLRNRAYADIFDGLA